VLGVEGFGGVEMEPAQHNALDQEPLKRGRRRTGKLLGERRAFPGVRLLHEEIITADRPDKGLPCCFGYVPHLLPIARGPVHPRSECWQDRGIALLSFPQELPLNRDVPYRLSGAGTACRLLQR
jgi:hypothetical protein